MYFPNNLTSVKPGFFALGAIPNVIGAIDGTHVPIVGLKKTVEQVYVNRKRWA